MSASDIDDLRYMRTSPSGGMHRSKLATTIAAIVVAATPLESGTASTYEIPPVLERTAAGPAGHIVPAPSDSTGEAVMEIRRRSGLTWEELGNLFDVSRRSVHHWASGKSVSARSEQTIRRILAAIRRLDQGSQTATRARLLAVNGDLGVSMVERLKQGHFIDESGRTDVRRTSEENRIPLSRAAEDFRRPPAPALLVEAEQDRPDIPARARIVRAARSPRKSG